ncbi:MAG: DNA repair protein RadC [Tissierellia bacterium]|nr:DNA repair protein RadC [Tissierellia bacterium]
MEGLSIKDQLKEYRPRERLLREGAASLADEELLAIILGSGIQGENVVDLSSRILRTLGQKDQTLQGIQTLSLATHADLVEIKGIKGAKCAQILALVEIARRMHREKINIQDSITRPSQAANLFMNEMQHLKQEEFHAVGLDSKKRIQYVAMITRGTLSSTLVHPREVFASAISNRAHSLILVHNHPTGQVSPSSEDIRLTERLKEVGSLVGIPVVDHLIIGDGTYYSFLEEGRL